MSQFFIESKTNEPQFFYFSQVIDENADYKSLISKIQENFDSIQQNNWQIFWEEEGEHIILQTWNVKYKDYLKDEEPSNENLEEHKDCIKSSNEGSDSKEESEQHSKYNVVDNGEQYLDSWNDLWEQHREEIYLEQYLLYTTIFYNYFLQFKNALEQQIPEQDDLEEETFTYSSNDYKQLSTELEQLKLLGLPTSFGGRPQNSSKKSKNHNKNQYFSDFFSESDAENFSSESEMENSPPTIDPSPERGDSNLHGTDNKTIKKVSQKAKKKNRKLKNVPSFMLEEKGLLKYWHKRFSLFSRFDEGIKLDRESWFSVTPEKVAKHMAVRLRCSVMVDGFCGSGGNAIQFALTCDKVIAIDIDPIKLDNAKHNAKIYKVAHKIEFIQGDFLQLASSGKLKADVVFLSPPWGGPQYKNKEEYDIEKCLLPVKSSKLVEIARQVSNNVALFLPRNANVKQIIRLAGEGNRCEIEHNYLDSRLVAITALYGKNILKKMSSKK